MCKTYAPVTGDEDENGKKRRADVAKMWRLRCNWIYTMVVTALVCVGYATPFSTLHQFITYPQENRTGTEQLGTSGLGTTGLGTSGLGESEIVYAWIVAMYSVGETIAAVGTGVLLHYFSYWSCYMFSVFLHLVGGVIYGLATNGVMMLVSRLLIGAHAGLGWSLAVAYYGERCEEYDQLKLELKGMREDRGVGEEDGRTVMEGKDGSSVEGNNGRNVEGKDGRNVEGKDGRNEEGKDGRNVEGNDGRNMVGEEDNCTEIGTNQAMEIVSGRKPEEQNDEGSSEYANTTDTVVAAKVKHVIRTKDLLHSLFAISNSLVSGFSVVLVILLQMIPGVDKFRIVGWINAVLAAGVMVLQLFMFRGEGYCTRDNRKVCKVLLGCLQIPWKCHRPGRKTMFLCVLVMVFYTIDSGYNIIDTLSNPILTNQFAFTVEDSGYFFAVATFGFAIGTLILPVLHRCRVDNRHTWVFSIALAFVGTLILADWQSIGSDPCTDPAFNSSSSCENSTFPGDECYWRQRSRVTGKLCLECPSGCASSKKMLNFAQFCGAFLLWVTAVPLVRAVSFIITSDHVGKSEQGTVLGICTAAGGLSRVVTPLWLNSLYVSTGQHTWAPMILLLLNLAAIIVGFLLLCGRTTCCWQQSPISLSSDHHAASHCSKQCTRTQQLSVPWSVVNGCRLDPTT
ncbi:hypothetical protein EMCRGX_G026157 [Ephydatia muelleri]